MKEELYNNIIDLLKENSALDFIEITNKLGYGKEMDNLIAEVLTEMVNKYDLSLSKKGRYMLFQNNEKNKDVYKGKYLDTKGTAGFVEVEGMDDIYIHGSKSKGAMEGDTVLVHLVKKAKDDRKAEGEILEIIKREVNNKVGEVYHFKKKIMVSLDDKKYKKLIYLDNTSETRRLVDGDKVVISFTSKEKDKDYVKARFVKRLGHINDPGIDILSIIADHEIDVDFSEESIKELENLDTEVKKKDLVGLKDLRDKMIFTIDGDDTKDIDDAISIRKLDKDNYELGVHIADVSYYVKKDSLLDKEAYERGTSVYLVDRVIPMLPHQLSNGICSLNPNVDRLAMSCIMKIDSKGKVVSYDIKESVIRSRIQMTYNKVNDILDNNVVADGYEEFVDELKLMKELSDILRKKMVGNGYIEFSSKEAKILVDDNCHPIDIKLRNEGTGENMIENFMVVANETVAGYIFYQGLPGIYRVHDKPDEKRLSSFFDFLSARGYVVTGKRTNITSKDLQHILKQLVDKPDVMILNDMAIRSQAKAIYSPLNIGHFGLGSKCYSHFTSPIRRYPDLILHRLLKDYMKKYSNDVISYWEEAIPVMAEHCSIKEQDAEKCERDVDDMKKAEYMEDHIGEIFEGIISGVQEFGMFVELPNTIEGLVKVADMPGGGYSYIEKSLCLISKNKKYKYSFGDVVKVKCINASHDTSMIDFELIGD